MKIEFSVAADQDIEAIFIYTIKQFGEAQAEKYYQALHHVLLLLAEQPEMGKAIDNIRVGYRRFYHESHAIYYTFNDDTLRINRILHTRSNHEELSNH